jgi:hypothetical protein
MDEGARQVVPLYYHAVESCAVSALETRPDPSTQTAAPLRSLAALELAPPGRAITRNRA